jgi:uncharacterized protein (UPF0548 family)
MAELRFFSDLDIGAGLEGLRGKRLNFAPEKEAEYTESTGWRIDHYREPLPTERPGPPATAGSWEVARRLATVYEFVDSKLVRAYYDPKEPLESRNMLLEVHFWGMRIYAGVRSGGVTDGIRREDGSEARVWSWSYRTLEGHFEMGQIDYQVWKWLDSGKVEFQIRALSRPAPIDDLVVRLGFLLFGRRKQKEFARRACERMRKLTSAEMGPAPGSSAAPTKLGPH